MLLIGFVEPRRRAPEVRGIERFSNVWALMKRKGLLEHQFEKLFHVPMVVTTVVIYWQLAQLGVECAVVAPTLVRRNQGTA